MRRVEKIKCQPGGIFREVDYRFGLSSWNINGKIEIHGFSFPRSKAEEWNLEHKQKSFDFFVSDWVQNNNNDNHNKKL